MKFTDLTPKEIENWFIEIGEKTYRAQQLSQWIYQKRNIAIQDLSNFSLSLRNKVQESFDFQLPTIQEIKRSVDGTRKLLIKLQDGSLVETVVMKHSDHWTICVSSQVGCAMGCRFCMTGTMGLKRNLSSGEIIDQVLLGSDVLQKECSDSIRNIVFMGMGEPLHNYKNIHRSLQTLNDDHGLNFGSRRITVSTSGLAKQILQMANEEKILANLAVSLNAPNQERRVELMPIGKKYRLDMLMDACREFTKLTKRRITFEYILMKDVSDSLEDAKKLVSLLSSFPNKVNLILYNDNPGLGFYRPDMDKVVQFQKLLINKGILATQRHSKGQDIAAACGQLVITQKKDS